MQDRTIVLFERGINGWQSIFGEWHNWPNQAIAYTHKYTPFKAQTLVYFTSPIFAGLTRHFRAKQVSKLIREYSTVDFRIIAVSHSEGTATMVKALRMAGWPRVSQLHLICGACANDFGALGLNFALRVGAIGVVHCYIAGRDAAMHSEDTWLGKFLFDLPHRSRPLGLTGPRNVDETISDRVMVHTGHPWDNYGHSTCFDSKHFALTMKQILSEP